jgi:hypothetical protein
MALFSQYQFVGLTFDHLLEVELVLTSNHGSSLTLYLQARETIYQRDTIATMDSADASLRPCVLRAKPGRLPAWRSLHVLR